MMTDVADFKHPEFLVSVDWLLENLEDPNLRIYDCTAHLIPHPTETYTIGSGSGTVLAGPITITGTITNSGTMVIL